MHDVVKGVRGVSYNYVCEEMMAAVWFNIMAHMHVNFLLKISHRRDRSHIVICT